MTDLTPSKICTGCRKRKPIGEFSNKKNGKYGKREKCRECQAKGDRKYYLKNRDRITGDRKIKRRLARTWKQKPSDYLLANCRKFYEENYPPELVREWYGEKEK